MRRADRLFEIIQLLRQAEKPVRAADLATRLEVSERTIYRDIVVLQSQQVPIEGEAGIGYILRQGYDLPPLMFQAEELDALLFGMRMVQSWGDDSLKQAAEQVLGKIHSVLPADKRASLQSLDLVAPDISCFRPEISVDMAALRQTIRDKQKISLEYRREDGQASTRTVWPLSLAFFGTVWNLIAWCELRQSFRTFRPDRIQSFTPRPETYPNQPGRTMQDFITYAKQRDKENGIGAS